MTKEEQRVNPEPTFRSELTSLINKYSLENTSNTPDYILADFLMSCLEAFDDATYARSEWYNPTKITEQKLKE